MAESVAPVSSCVVSKSPDSSGESTCLICLRGLQCCTKLGKPENCGHIFCFTCIRQWGENVNTCPVDRIKFNHIEVIKSGQAVNKVFVSDKQLTQVFDDANDVTYCEVCHECNNEDRLLLCDGCDKGYHLECLTPPLTVVPEGNWYCPSCDIIIMAQYEDESYSTSMEIFEPDSIDLDSESASSASEYMHSSSWEEGISDDSSCSRSIPARLRRKRDGVSRNKQPRSQPEANSQSGTKSLVQQDFSLSLSTDSDNSVYAFVRDQQRKKRSRGRRVMEDSDEDISSDESTLVLDTRRLPRRKAGMLESSDEEDEKREHISSDVSCRTPRRSQRHTKASINFEKFDLSLSEEEDTHEDDTQSQSASDVHDPQQPCCSQQLSRKHLKAKRRMGRRCDNLNLSDDNYYPVTQEEEGSSQSSSNHEEFQKNPHRYGKSTLKSVKPKKQPSLPDCKQPSHSQQLERTKKRPLKKTARRHNSLDMSDDKCNFIKQEREDSSQSDLNCVSLRKKPHRYPKLAHSSSVQGSVKSEEQHPHMKAGGQTGRTGLTGLNHKHTISGHSRALSPTKDMKKEVTRQKQTRHGSPATTEGPSRQHNSFTTFGSLSGQPGSLATIGTSFRRYEPLKTIGRPSNSESDNSVRSGYGSPPPAKPDTAVMKERFHSRTRTQSGQDRRLGASRIQSRRDSSRMGGNKIESGEDSRMGGSRIQSGEDSRMGGSRIQSGQGAPHNSDLNSEGVDSGRDTQRGRRANHQRVKHSTREMVLRSKSHSGVSFESLPTNFSKKTSVPATASSYPNAIEKRSQSTSKGKERMERRRRKRRRRGRGTRRQWNNSKREIVRKRTHRRQRKIVLNAKKQRLDNRSYVPYGGFYIKPQFTRSRARTVATHGPSPFAPLIRTAAIAANKHTSAREGLRAAQELVNQRNWKRIPHTPHREGSSTPWNPSTPSGRTIDLTTPQSGYNTSLPTPTPSVTPHSYPRTLASLWLEDSESSSSEFALRETGAKERGGGGIYSRIAVSRRVVPRKKLSLELPPPPLLPQRSDIEDNHRTRRESSGNLLDDISHGLDVLGSRESIIRRDGTIVPITNSTSDVSPGYLSPICLSDTSNYSHFSLSSSTVDYGTVAISTLSTSVHRMQPSSVLSHDFTGSSNSDRDGMLSSRSIASDSIPLASVLDSAPVVSASDWLISSDGDGLTSVILRQRNSSESLDGDRPEFMPGYSDRQGNSPDGLDGYRLLDYSDKQGMSSDGDRLSTMPSYSNMQRNLPDTLEGDRLSTMPGYLSDDLDRDGLLTMPGYSDMQRSSSDSLDKDRLSAMPGYSYNQTTPSDSLDRDEPSSRPDYSDRWGSPSHESDTSERDGNHDGNQIPSFKSDAISDDEMFSTLYCSFDEKRESKSRSASYSSSVDDRSQAIMTSTRQEDSLAATGDWSEDVISRLHNNWSEYSLQDQYCSQQIPVTESADLSSQVSISSSQLLANSSFTSSCSSRTDLETYSPSGQTSFDIISECGSRLIQAFKKHLVTQKLRVSEAETTASISPLNSVNVLRPQLPTSSNCSTSTQVSHKDSIASSSSFSSSSSRAKKSVSVGDSSLSISSPLQKGTADVGHSEMGKDVGFKKEPEEFVKRFLKPYLAKGEITNYEYGRILERATRKARSGWTRNSSEERVKKLVVDFVKAYKNRS